MPPPELFPKKRIIETANSRPIPGAKAICHNGRVEISANRISSVSISKPAIRNATMNPVAIDKRRTGLFPVGSSFLSFSIRPFIQVLSV